MQALVKSFKLHTHQHMHTGSLIKATPSPLQVLQLEDAKAKARRLSNEGVTLAEAERWWAAIGRWNAALALTPEDHTIHEMLAQAYMQVGRCCACDTCIAISIYPCFF